MDAPEQWLIHISPDVSIFVSRRGKVDLHGEEVPGIKAEIGCAVAGNAAQQDAGNHQQNQGKRDLADYEDRAQAVVCPCCARAPSAAQCLVGICS